jgi:hypothetical protein
MFIIYLLLMRQYALITQPGAARPTYQPGVMLPAYLSSSKVRTLGSGVKTEENCLLF